MKKFKSFYRMESIVVTALTQYEASCKALKIFKAKYKRRKIKSYEIHSHLVEDEGNEAIHKPLF